MARAVFALAAAILVMAAPSLARTLSQAPAPAPSKSGVSLHPPELLAKVISTPYLPTLCMVHAHAALSMRMDKAHAQGGPEIFHPRNGTCSFLEETHVVSTIYSQAKTRLPANFAFSRASN